MLLVTMLKVVTALKTQMLAEDTQALGFTRECIVNSRVPLESCLHLTLTFVTTELTLIVPAECNSLEILLIASIIFTEPSEDCETSCLAYLHLLEHQNPKLPESNPT